MYLFLSCRSEKEVMFINSDGSDFIESMKSVRTSTEFSDLRVISNDGYSYSGHQCVCLPYVRDILRGHRKVPDMIMLPVPKHYIEKILELAHQGRVCPALSSKEEDEFLVHAENMGLRNIVVTIATKTNKTMIISSKSSNNIVNNSLNAQPRNVCIIRSAPHSSLRYQPYMPTAALSRGEIPCNVSVSISFSLGFFHNINLFNLIEFRYMLFI